MIPSSFSSFWSSSSTWPAVAPQLWNHLWQSTLFAVAVALVALVLRRYPARVRYWLWMAASVKFLIPFSLLIAAGAHFARPTVPAPSVSSAYVALGEMSEPFTVDPVLTSTPAPEPAHTHHLSLPGILAALWLSGFAIVLAVWLLQWRRIANSIRQATLLHDGRVFATLRRVEQLVHITRPIRILSSPGPMEPGVFGVLRPVLLWPEAISPHLDDAHLEAVLAHEACHVRRRDNLTSFAHMLVEALFWFHPLVWWMESQLVKARESACDEEVLLLCARPQAYAESILKVCEFCVESPLKCVSGITGADLKKRVVQIMTNPAVRRLGVGVKCLLLLAALTALAIPFALGQVKAARAMVLTALQSAPASVRGAASAMLGKTDAPSAEQSQMTPDSDAAADGTGVDPAFEVASIRPTIPGNDSPVGYQVLPSGRVRIMRQSVKGMITFAYISNAGGGLVEGGPDWIDSELFDINAKVDDAEVAAWSGLSDTQQQDRVRPMIRTLLAQRFHLKLHTETQTRPVYALVQAKGGAKFKAVDPPPPHMDEQALEESRKSAHPTALPGMFMMSYGTWTGNAIPISVLLSEIAGNVHADRLVVDQTGLKGFYDFTFKQSWGEDAPILQDQIEEQLGLKLEPRKLPVKIYVIDSAEKPSVDGSGAQDATAAEAPRNLPEFEVVSLKPSDPNAGHHMGVQLSPDRIAMNFETVRDLISVAYNIPYDEVSCAEPWMERDIYDPKDHFDFEAKLPQDLGPYDMRHGNFDIVDKRIREMMQAMLADRFHLKFHIETAIGTLSLLERSGKSLRLVPSKLKYAENYGRGFSQIAGAVPGRSVSLYNASMPQLARFLSQYVLHHPVVDKTGLDGDYDFTATRIITDEDYENGYGMQAFLPAVNEMGLKLTQTTGPVEKFVIDHAERPSPN